jgi:hypothetical protein
MVSFLTATDLCYKQDTRFRTAALSFRILIFSASSILGNSSHLPKAWTSCSIIDFVMIFKSVVQTIKVNLLFPSTFTHSTTSYDFSDRR